MLRKRASVGVFPNRQTIVNCFISLVFITASAQRLKVVYIKRQLRKILSGFHMIYVDG